MVMALMPMCVCVCVTNMQHRFGCSMSIPKHVLRTRLQILSNTLRLVCVCVCVFGGTNALQHINQIIAAINPGTRTNNHWASKFFFTNTLIIISKKKLVFSI